MLNLFQIINFYDDEDVSKFERHGKITQVTRTEEVFMSLVFVTCVVLKS